MKKHLFYLMIVFVSLFSCISQDDEADRYDHHSLEFDLYKTKADYFNYIMLSSRSLYPSAGGQNIIIRGEDTIHYKRYRMHNGYVFDQYAEPDYVFSDITCGELYRNFEAHHKDWLTDQDSISKRVLDDDPFLEYYRKDTIDFDGRMIPTLEALLDTFNKLIDENKIETFFDKIK